MNQTATILTRTGSIQVELPPPDAIVLRNVRWGSLDAFPTPAYWQYQAVSRRLSGRPPAYKLGRTLAEELGACLLGGHGIPATVGVAAYERLRAWGAFTRCPTQGEFEAWLREPMQVDGRKVRYRFASQKAKYLATAMPTVHRAPEFSSGRQLRDWLMKLRGVGPKTASWVARNWLDANDVAILDIHIMRVCQTIGLFPRKFSVERNYLELEALFLEFGKAIDVRPSELDAVIWNEMATSPNAARFLSQHLTDTLQTPLRGRRKAKADSQLPLTLTA